MRRRPVIIFVGATAAGLGAVVLSTLMAGTSSAQGVPSDPRAEFIMGNVAPGDCRGLGAPIPESAITFTITNGQILTITAVDPGFVVAAIFVKGGADTNLYQPGLRGLPQDPPWINLISPLTGGGQLPAISHWFACGSVTPPTTTTTAPTTTTTAPTTTTTAPTTTTTAPTTTTTAPTTTTTAPTTTTTAPTTTVPGMTTTTSSAVLPTSAVGPVDPDDIPTTGSDTEWLQIVGLFLMGFGLLAVVAGAWPRRSYR